MVKRRLKDAFASMIEDEKKKLRREKKVFSLVFNREERRKKPVMETIIEQLSKCRPRMSEDAIKKQASQLFETLKRMGYILNY